LPGRPGMAEAADAWEYAVSADGWGARFYQFVPGQGPRVVATFAVAKTSGHGIRVTIPRRYFRGDPESWGYAVAVMGRSRGGGRCGGIGAGTGPFRRRGAGARGAALHRFVGPGALSQRRILGAYKSGQDITIPFVRTE
jgi:hypothetical protein